MSSLRGVGGHGGAAGIGGAGGTVSPTREDPVVAAASAVVGGPAGRRVAPGRRTWWTVARVLVVASMVMLALAVVQKQHCRSVGWSTPDMFFHTCYSDLPVVYEQSGLAAGDAPYAATSDGHYLQQPVLTGLAMWGLAKIVPDGTVVKQDPPANQNAAPGTTVTIWVAKSTETTACPA